MDLVGIRSRMPLLQELVYLNTGGISPSLNIVTDVFHGYFDRIARTGPPLIVDSVRNASEMEDAHKRIASFLHIDPNDLCLTRGVTDGVHLVFNGFDWNPGDEMILTDEEHPAVQVPADRLAKACGVTLKRLAIAGGPEMILKRFRDLITPRTRLAALSHVTTDTGTRLPVEAMVRVAHEREVPVLLDGAQSLGQFPVNVKAIGADFYSYLSYKWMFGPFSTGGLYIARSWQGRLKLVATGRQAEQALPEPPENGAQRFEIGQLSQPLYYATAVALDFIEGLGLSAIESVCTRRAAALCEGLKTIPGLVVHSPAPPDGAPGIVAFSVKGIEGTHINTQLRARRMIPRPTGLKFSGVRVSVAFFNTDEEIEELVKTVAEIVKKAV
ncbi:MAG: aminotransferase class V-fold PLP-dependent enzyme [candidate division Zixibacteria bacterium]|nr:aminotransferase class V-fold PLP-dependent enzyme [candidate division Zixibacteria bacterium]